MSPITLSPPECAVLSQALRERRATLVEAAARRRFISWDTRQAPRLRATLRDELRSLEAAIAAVDGLLAKVGA